MANQPCAWAPVISVRRTPSARDSPRYAESSLRGLHGVVVPAFEGVRGGQVVDVVPVVAVAVELVLLHPVALVHGGRGERLRGILPAAGLRIDVPGHVQRVRNVGHQLRVLLAARPGVLGEGRAFEAVDDVVVHARDAPAPWPAARAGSRPPPCCPGAFGFLSGSVKPRMIISARSSCASTSSGCFASSARSPCTKASSGSLASGSRRAAIGGDVQLLQVGRLAGHLAQFDGLLRRRARARRGRRGTACPATCGLQVELEARTPVAGRHHRDAPLRHRRRRDRARPPAGTSAPPRAPRRNASAPGPGRRTAALRDCGGDGAGAPSPCRAAVSPAAWARARSAAARSCRLSAARLRGMPATSKSQKRVRASSSPPPVRCATRFAS